MEAQKVLSRISDDELNWQRQKSYYDRLSHEETIRDEANEKGFQNGYESGKKVGYKDGYDSGKKEGYDSGKKEGYNNGYDSGKKEGYDSGLEQGARETAIKNAISMLNEGDSPEKASRCTGLPLEEVQKLTETMKK